MMKMLGEIFYWAVNASIIGSFAGLIVLLLRRVHALPRFGIYLLWALPFIRLWIPFGFANRYSLLNFISKYATRTVVVWEAAPSAPEVTMTNAIQGAASYFPIEYKTDLLRDVFSVAGAVWIIIAAAAVLCSAMLYIFTKSALKDAKHIKDNIYSSGKITSPAVYGIIKPRIILPAGAIDAGLDHILLHEKIHIRRRDNLWRVIAVITASVHWFNPLAWIFLKYFFTDMELACDAGVLKKLDDSEKKAYAATLLSYSAGRTYYVSAFGGAKTRLRIENILSYKKLTLASCVCFSALCLAVAVTIITNAVG